MVLIHNNKKVICIISDETTFLTKQVVFNGTQAECDAEIARLDLTPLPPPPPTRPPRKRPNPPINESPTPS